MKLFRDTAIYMFPIAALCCASQVVVTGAEWPAKPKVFYSVILHGRCLLDLHSRGCYWVDLLFAVD